MILPSNTPEPKIPLLQREDASVVIASSEIPKAELSTPEFHELPSERKEAISSDFAPSVPPEPVIAKAGVPDSPYLIQCQAKAVAQNCKVLRVVDQSNSDFDHENIRTDAGRCQSIAAVHAFSQLHGRADVWNAYTDPSDKQLGFSMLQRGGLHSEQYEKEIITNKLREFAQQNPSWVNTLKGWAGMLPSLNPMQLRQFKDFSEERVRLNRLSFVPGSRTVASEELGPRLDLAGMVSSLPTGVHLLKLTLNDGRSHMLSCNISDRTDIPSRLMDPNACEWEGHEADLGKLLQHHWEELGLIDRWCKNGSWQRLTFGLGLDLADGA